MVEFDKGVEKVLSKLDKQTAKRITSKIREVSQLDDPRLAGKALTGSLVGLWRYRVGDYRVICDIEDGVMVILVVDVAHRREVYRRRR